MPEQVTTIDPAQATQADVTPVINQPASDVNVSPEQSTDDILAKVTKKVEPKLTPDTSGTFKEFDDITDPALKQRMIDKTKALQADYTRKTQEVAQQRTQLQTQLKEMENWTPDKVQNYLLKNPSFLQAAQTIAAQPQNPTGSGLTDEQFSALTPTEKNQMLEMNRQIGELRQQNFISAMTQKDALLQTKYGDYDSLKVNEGLQNLSRTNPLDLREHVYKAIFHDEHVKNAYEMGKKDAQGLNQQRTQAVTTATGVNMMPASDVPKKEKGENDINYFARLAQRRIDLSKQGTALRK